MHMLHVLSWYYATPLNFTHPFAPENVILYSGLVRFPHKLLCFVLDGPFFIQHCKVAFFVLSFNHQLPVSVVLLVKYVYRFAKSLIRG